VLLSARAPYPGELVSERRGANLRWRPNGSVAWVSAAVLEDNSAVKLYVLNGGQLYAEKGFFLHFGTEADTGKDYLPETLVLQSSQYFVDHPQAKILFDLGYKDEEFKKVIGFPHRMGPEARYHKQEPDENPLAQLAKVGVTVDDIDYVVLSHLMSEHAGWLPSFAGTRAKIVVQAKEYDYARRIGNPPPPGETALEQFHSWMYARDQFELPGLDFLLIDGDYDLVGDDVRVLGLPGHTPGYQALQLRLPRTGTVVLSGCEISAMYYSIPLRGYAPGIPHSFTWFAAGELASLKRVRDLVAAENGRIFCGHDAGQFAGLRHAPEYYD
jgi:N-acyl homoserine lactone hydrolase